MKTLSSKDTADDEAERPLGAKNPDAQSMADKHGSMPMPSDDAVTALRNMNSELIERQLLTDLALADANTELDIFSHTVSHDLRTPIRAIQIFTNLLQKAPQNLSEQDAKTYLTNILKCTVEMNDLINDLLTFTRLNSKEIRAAETDMHATAIEVANSIQAAINNTDIEIIVNPLPSIDADAKLMSNLFLNLLSNAVKFRKKEGHCVIAIGAEKVGNSVTYFVNDNGIGFDVKYYNKLFKPFSKLHPPSEYKGTGAGLAICDRIVKKHGGSIWAQSILNVGSTFYFSLPLNRY